MGEREHDLQKKVEAVLFASPEPLTVASIAETLGAEQVEVEKICQRLLASYNERGGGFRLYSTSEGFQFQTVADISTFLQRLNKARPLSRASLETLAIVAYRQPVTRAEIEYIRGVESGNLLRSLLERELLVCVGRKESVGKPLLFGTAREFLRVFALDSLEDLPPLSSFQMNNEVQKLAEEKISSQQTVHLEKIVGEQQEETNREFTKEAITESGVEESAPE